MTTPKASSQLPTLSLSGPDDVIRAVPLLLGFHPAESVVALFLAGPRRRLLLTARVDLPAAREEVALAAQLLARARHAGADTVLVTVHTHARGGPGELPRRRLVAALDGDPGVDLAEAVLVRAGRRWCYRCPASSCCPAEGAVVGPSPAAERLAAAGVLAGRAVLADRDALVAALAAPVTDVALQERYVATERVLAARRAADGAEAARAATVAGLVRLAAAVPGGPAVCEELLREVALGLHEVTARDRALVSLPAADEVLAALVAMARQCPPPWDAPLCAVLAWRAYCQGDGALARVALDRALRTDPEYGLARLLDGALDRQVPPSVLAAITDAAAAELLGG